MNLSRRQLLFFAPVVITLACCRSPARPVISVRDFGAVGDGVADDSAAITAAAAAVRPGSTLHFPSGAYRFAQAHPPTAAAVLIAGVSDVVIDFAPDAELIMDNADLRSRTGTGHGILIRGPASDISLQNIRIRWTTETTRSMGDGIRIVGCPEGWSERLVGWDGPAAPVSAVTVSNCHIESAPQAGVVMAGVSDIIVSDLRVERTQADGLHFNACRQARIDGHDAVDTGDDGIALVTYFSETASFDPVAETFAFPELTEWSNADFTIANVTVAGSRANGIRLAGAHRVAVDGLTATDVRYGAAVMIDSATSGHDVDWEYVASREVRLAGIAADDCETGLHVLARPLPAADRRFTEFGIDLVDTRMRRCTNWSVRIESLSDERVTGITLQDCTIDATSASGGNGGFGLANAQDVQLGALSLQHTVPVTIFSAINTGQFVAETVRLVLTHRNGSDGAAPCAVFDNADGGIRTLEVRWPAAPRSWKPVRVAPGAACEPGSSPLAVDRLIVEPPFLADGAVIC